MASEFDKLVQRTTVKLFALENPSLRNYDMVLKRRLLGLLEAGQANRDANMLNLEARLEWDAAKQAAMAKEPAQKDSTSLGRSAKG